MKAITVSMVGVSLKIDKIRLAKVFITGYLKMRLNRNLQNTYLNQQKIAYDGAYAEVKAFPFPDHKIEGDQVPISKTIISIGGGTGADLAHLAKKNEVFLIDFSSTVEKIAKIFGLVPIQLDLSLPGMKLPFSDASVDIVVLKDILEHMLDPSIVMAEVSRVLKKEGYIVVSIPNHFNAWGRLRIFFGSNIIWRGILHDHNEDYNEWNYMHIRFFTWRGLNNFLELSGFRIKKSFLDFGPLAHYFSLPMIAEHLEIKSKSVVLTRKAVLFLKIIYPIYRAANFLFPLSIREKICMLSPSFFTSGFYVHARKNSPTD